MLMAVVSPQNHFAGNLKRIVDRPYPASISLSSHHTSEMSLTETENKIIDDILELLNKNGLTSHHSMNLLERLGRIIEMGQRVAKGTTY